MAGRKNIYYWKSDRAFATENTRSTATSPLHEVTAQVTDYLNRFFRNDLIQIQPTHGQGNHITLVAKYPDRDYFIRLENGPEGDNYMAIESKIMTLVRSQGIPCPEIYLTDVSRLAVPFAIQIMELIEGRDLNFHSRDGGQYSLDIAHSIGAFVAQWQDISMDHFGLFNLEKYQSEKKLEGYHTNYLDYYMLNLDIHLDFLVRSQFLTVGHKKNILELVREYESLLRISQGCLVHKDLAFWNIMSDGKQIKAFIDWDDAICGDPVDDLSLLACFHSGSLVASAIDGYAQVRKLPDHFEMRFWLHLLRNMIFKAVIRVKGNYFDMSDHFFMNNGNQNDLKAMTIKRINNACNGLLDKQTILDL